MHPILPSDLHDGRNAAPKLLFGVIGRVEEDPRSTRYIFYQQVVAELLGMAMLQAVLAFGYARHIGCIVGPRQLDASTYFYIVEEDAACRDFILIRPDQFDHCFHDYCTSMMSAALCAPF